MPLIQNSLTSGKVGKTAAEKLRKTAAEELRWINVSTFIPLAQKLVKLGRQLDDILGEDDLAWEMFWDEVKIEFGYELEKTIERQIASSSAWHVADSLHYHQSLSKGVQMLMKNSEVLEELPLLAKAVLARSPKGKKKAQTVSNFPNSEDQQDTPLAEHSYNCKPSIANKPIKPGQKNGQHDESDLSNPEEKKEVELAKKISDAATELLEMHKVSGKNKKQAHTLNKVHWKKLGPNEGVNKKSNSYYTDDGRLVFWFGGEKPFKHLDNLVRPKKKVLNKKELSKVEKAPPNYLV